MKTFTTSIFVPPVAKEAMCLLEANELDYRLNRVVSLPSDLCHGGLDSVVQDEEFILIVNGLFERYEIKMKGFTKGSGKIFFMVSEPDLPEVYRFLQWRIKPTNLMSSNNGKRLQLRNFSVIELRRLIRHCLANKEKSLVTYR